MHDYKPIENEIFHVHTYRCKHAGDAQDYEYVKKAIELEAPRIVFTDHAPFPGNPFGNRMDIEELPEYIESINKLKQQYQGKIEILCGLEIEYLPSFDEYYKSLNKMDGLDLLVLGQHFYEHKNGEYSFNDEVKSKAFVGLCEAIAKGIKTGYFAAVAHPDRAFRKKDKWTDKKQEVAMKLVDAIKKLEQPIYLEKNYSSMQKKGYYWPEFWRLLGDYKKIFYGLDAHSLEELENGYKRINSIMSPGDIAMTLLDANMNDNGPEKVVVDDLLYNIYEGKVISVKFKPDTGNDYVRLETDKGEVITVYMDDLVSVKKG